MYLARVKGYFGSNVSRLKALKSIDFRQFDTDESELSWNAKKRKDDNDSSESQENTNGMEYDNKFQPSGDISLDLKKLNKKAKRERNKRLGKKTDPFFSSADSIECSDILNGIVDHNQNAHNMDGECQQSYSKVIKNARVAPVVEIGYMLGDLDLSELPSPIIADTTQLKQGEESDPAAIDCGMESTGCWVQCPIKAISHRYDIHMQCYI